MKTNKLNPSDLNQGWFTWLLPNALCLIITLVWSAIIPASAQIPSKQLQFDFNESGTTTTDSVNQVVLNELSAYGGSATDLHSGPGAGPVGNDNCLTWGSAGSGGFGGPIAVTTGNTNINFGVVTNFTMSMWVNPLSMQGGINPRIFVLGANATAVDPSSANTFGWQGNQSGGYNAAYNTVATANKVPSLLSGQAWTFVTWTYTNGLWKIFGGGTNNPVAQLYSESDAFTAANIGSTFALALGNRINSTSRTFAGELAHVSFYLGAAQADYIEYVRESSWPLGSLAWVTAPAGTNINFGSGGFNLATNQYLTGGGAVVGNVTNSAGSQILPGYASTIGTLTFSNNLTLVGGGQLGYYLGTPADTIAVKGNFAASGVTLITISNIPPSGTYTLLTASGSFGATAANFQVVSNANLTGKLANLTATTNKLILSVAGARAPANLTWVGDGSANAWDIITSSNWLNGASASTYYDGDTANFTDAGVANLPTLNVTVNPAAVIFNATNNYSLTGGGHISGATAVTKTGSGNLSMLTYNSYSGGTVVQGGVLTIVNGGSGAGLGNPSGTLLTVTNGGSFDLSGNAILNSTANPIVISGPGVAANQGALCSSVGVVTLPNYYGPVCARSIVLAGDAAIGNDTYGWQLGPDVNSGNGIGGYLDGQGHSLTKVGDNTVVLEVRNISPLSQFVIGNGGIIYANTGVSPIGPSASILITNNAWMDSWDNFTTYRGNFITNNITIANGGGQLCNTLGAQGNGTADRDTYYGNVTLNDNLTITNTSFYNNVFGTMTFDGAITGTGNIVIQGLNYLTGIGQNTVIFNGANTYSGTTMVTNYETLETTTANQSGGAYIVVDGAVLDVVGAGASAALPTSSLLLDSENIGGGSVSFSRATTLSSTKPLIYATNLTINAGTIIPPSAANYVVGDFPLIQYIGSIAGTGGFTALQFDSSVLPAGVTAVLTNNLANNSIDLLVTSAPALPVSTNAVLSGLSLSPVVSFSPTFVSNVLSGYTATVPYGSPTVTVINADLTATNVLSLNGSGLGTLPSGTPSGPLSLILGATNSLQVSVTAQDGVTTNLYQVSVVEQPSQVAPHLASRFSGGALSLSWPADHLGWRLLVQTNNLSRGISANASDWTTVSGSTSVTTTNIPVIPTNLDEYYQLVYP